MIVQVGLTLFCLLSDHYSSGKIIIVAERILEYWKGVQVTKLEQNLDQRKLKQKDWTIAQRSK